MLSKHVQASYGAPISHLAWSLTDPIESHLAVDCAWPHRAFEGPQGRISVVGPVTPGGAGQAILANGSQVSATWVPSLHLYELKIEKGQLPKTIGVSS